MNLYDLHSTPAELYWYSKKNKLPETAFYEIMFRGKSKSADEIRDLEKSISKDAYYSYQYAKNILRDVFPQGEAAIAKDAEAAYFYAAYVIKDRFPAGEDVILKDPFFHISYRRKHHFFFRIYWQIFINKG